LIISFVKDVDLGAGNNTANRIDWADWEKEPPPYSKTNKPGNWDQVRPGDSCPLSTSNHPSDPAVKPRCSRAFAGPENIFVLTETLSSRSFDRLELLVTAAGYLIGFVFDLVPGTG
jgi:hypothetical protein